MKNYKDYLTTPASCDVCKQSIFVDPFGNNSLELCKQCGWRQNESSLDCPNEVRYPNKISFTKAKKRYENKKFLEPDFEDFIEMFDCFGEVEFKHKGIRYGLTASNGVVVEFFVIDGAELQEYKSIEDFIAKANINGNLIKDIWHEVENIDWLN